MKVTFFYFFLLFFTSCSFPTYVFQNNNQTIGLNFAEGKWLLNEINAPIGIEDKLTKSAIKDFSKFTNGNLDYSVTTKKLLMQKINKSNLNTAELKKIKIGTNYDYFININAQTLKNEINNINIRNHKFQTEGSKEISIVLEVYDLNNLVVLYSQEVKGFVKLPQNSNDVTLSYSINNLVLGGYKKIIRDITKKSIKK